MTGASRERQVKLKYVCRIEMGQSPPSERYSLSSQDAKPFLQGTAEFGERHPEPRTYCSGCSKFAKTGDILLSVRAPVGEMNIADQSYGIGRGLCAVRPQTDLSRQFAWWALLHSRDELNRIATGSTYDAVSAEDVGNLCIYVPPLQAQRAIADYLDREISEIDSLVSAKQRLLDILAEKRRAVISNAVTRGLDPKAPVRDSGIAWLGEIPKHWEIRRIGLFARVGNGSTPSREEPAYWDGDYPWLNSSQVHRGFIDSANQFVTSSALEECHLPRVPAGSVLVAITGQGKTRGTAAVLGIEATISQHIAYITPDASVASPEYLQLSLSAAYEFLRAMSDDSGGTKGALTCEDLQSFRLTLPPLIEQQIICAYIAERTVRLDALRNATQRSIHLLNDRRTSLIAAAVTGQISIPASSGGPV